MKETYSRWRQLRVLCQLTDTVLNNWEETLFSDFIENTNQTSEFGGWEL